MREREISNLRVSRNEAEVIALKALGFLVSDPERAGRFLRFTGVEPHDLRAKAGDPNFLAGVVEHLMTDESLLVAFSQNYDIDPKMPALAVEILRDGRDAG